MIAVPWPALNCAVFPPWWRAPRVPEGELYNQGAILGLKALGYGTLLCAAFGGVMVYSIHRYYGVNSIEEFARAMQSETPGQHRALRSTLDPLVDRLSAVLATRTHQAADHMHSILSNLPWLHRLRVDEQDESQGEQDVVVTEDTSN